MSSDSNDDVTRWLTAPQPPTQQIAPDEQGGQDGVAADPWAGWRDPRVGGQDGVADEQGGQDGVADDPWLELRGPPVAPPQLARWWPPQLVPPPPPHPPPEHIDPDTPRPDPSPPPQFLRRPVPHHQPMPPHLRAANNAANQQRWSQNNMRRWFQNNFLPRIAPYVRSSLDILFTLRMVEL